MVVSSLQAGVICSSSGQMMFMHPQTSQLRQEVVQMVHQPAASFFGQSFC
jgi:hypothetical protein